MDDVEVHILPCLIKYNGRTDFKKRFKNKIKKVPDHVSDDDSIPGGYELKELCGYSANNVDFSVKVTENYVKDVYYPLKGTDKLLREKYYLFFRGRQLRGSELALDELGYKMMIVEVNKPVKASDLTKHDCVESKTLRMTSKVCSLTLWELEEDVSPVSVNVAAYRYLSLSKAVSVP
ncbi:hypothetical protein MACK_001298 [Theileria orientalis]|uniref:Uncharacterized protein n=1 Tax=Theileria orientalis TaxID=68886 RepID=A0A976MC70_THEOR|nr:hypothetical protein MACK_001298 [Theileria orientalis]